MSDPQGRLTIGEFARATGISASALRFYHDCGLVVPGEIDPVTGYRYYHRRQVPQALVLRHLRGAGLRIAQVRPLLAAPPPDVREALAEHLAGMERALRQAQSSAAAALSVLAGGRRGVAVVAGGELADAARRACRSVDRSLERTDDLTVVSGVLIEVRDRELTLVATDRYRMVVQSLPLDEAEECEGACAVVTATALQRLGPWLRQQDRVRLEFDQAPGPSAAQAGDVTTQVRLGSAREERVLAAIPEQFPDYRMLLDHMPAPATRILASRRELLTATRDAGAGPVCWDADPRRGLRVIRPGPDRRAVSVDAEIRGDGVVLGFDPARLRAVLTDGAGPDLGFQIARPDQPVVIRSAHRTGITSVLMPMPAFPRPDTPAHDSTGAA
ncbi:MAG TPA: MerR family transcriptional regulator [Kineosporiaceae bacterium]|nr:MerR family transcriptional regulator [Kineosporiaceae bacterium]